MAKADLVLLGKKKEFEDRVMAAKLIWLKEAFWSNYTASKMMLRDI